MKQKRKQRVLAVLLACAMTLQQAVVPVVAEDLYETESVTEAASLASEETSAPETQAPETSAPETQAPETKAPETQAPETKAPETSAPETQAPETKAPETSAPETQAPETKAPETSAPETQAPETQAPETSAPETKAPETQATEAETKAPETQATEAETKAPETQATESETQAPETQMTESETQAPETQMTESETQAPQTEAPATEPVTEEMTEDGGAVQTEESEPMTETETESETESETETETESESEIESESETEAPKTDFRYEDSRVVITAVAQEEAKLPQDAELKADYLVPGSEEYKAAVAAIEAQLAAELGADQENVVVDYVLYDIYFVSSSEDRRIEPEEGYVKVEMTFRKLQEANAEGEVINKDVVHLKDNGQAEIVTDYVNTNSEGEVTSMGFTQDSFSVVGGAVVYSVEETQVLNGNEFDTSNAKPISSVGGSVQISIQKDGQGVDNIKTGTSYDIGLHVEMPEIDPNQVYYVELGSEMNQYFGIDTTNIPTSPETARLMGSLGKWYLDTSSNRVYMLFSSTPAAATDIVTDISFSASAKEISGESGSNISIPIGDKDFNVKWYGTHSSMEVSKTDNSTYDEETGEVTFTVTATSKDGKNIVRSLKDDFTMLGFLGEPTVSVKGPDGTLLGCTTTKTGTSFTTTLDEEFILAAGESMTFEYTMKVDRSNAVNGTNVVGNTATVNFKDSWDEDKSQSSLRWEREIIVKRPSVTKTKGEEIPADGDQKATVEWNLKAEMGDTYLDQGTTILDDSWDHANLELKDLENATVKVTYDMKDEDGAVIKEETGSITFSDLKDSAALVINENGKNFTVDFVALAQKMGISNIKICEIQYKTDIDITAEGLGSGQSRPVTNSVDIFKDGVKTDGDVADVTVSNDSDSGLGVMKTHEGILDTEVDGIRKVEWVSELTIKAGSYKKLYVHDTVESNPDNINQIIWRWLDVEVPSNNPASVEIASPANNSIITSIDFSSDKEKFNGLKLEATDLKWGADRLDKNPHYEGFILTLIDSAAEVTFENDVTVKIHYVSYYDQVTAKKNWQGVELTNKIDFSNGQDTVSTSDTISSGFVKGGVEKSVYGNLDHTNGIVTWNVKVKEDVLKSLYFNESNSTWNWPTTANFVDMIPDNMHLISFWDQSQNSDVKVGASTHGNSYGTEFVLDNSLITENGRVLTVDILSSLKKYYEEMKKTGDLIFVYQTQITDYDKYLKGGKTSYENSVVLNLGSGISYPDSSSAELNPGGNFTKSTGSKTGDFVEFSIDGFYDLIKKISEQKENYTEAVLVDQYGSALRYDSQNFDVKYGETPISATQGDGIYYEIDTATHTIKFHIPVSSLISGAKITYKLKVVPTSEDNESYGSNKVWLLGYEKVQSSSKVSTSESSATGSYNGSYISVSKTGKYINSSGQEDEKPLRGIRFTLHNASVVDDKLTYDKKCEDSVITLADGRASFAPMIYTNQLYAIVEDPATTPANYEPENPIYVMCYHENSWERSELSVGNTRSVEFYSSKGVQIITAPTKGIVAHTLDVVNAPKKSAAELALSGTKTLDAQKVTTAEAFKFKVEDKTEGALAGQAIVPEGPFKNDANGNFVINGISFKKIGTYTLEVSEVNESATNPTISYDTKKYTVIVTVGEKSDHSGYEVTNVQVDGSIVTAQDGIYAIPLAEGKAATFENTTKEEDKGSLTVTKVVSGNTAPTGTAESPVTYEVVVQAPTDADLSDVAATSQKTGATEAVKKEVVKDIAKKTIKFTFEKGEIVNLTGLPYGDYTVTETVQGSAAAYTASYQVGTDGAVTTGKADVTVGATTPGVTVTNTYPNETSVVLKGTKSVDEDMPNGKTFTFELTGTGITGSKPATITTPETPSVTPDNSTFTFDTLTYSSSTLVAGPNVFDYTVKEQYPTGAAEVKDSSGNVTGHKAEGIVYDAAVYSVKVTITKDANNALTKKVEVKRGTDDAYTELTPNADGSYSLTSGATFANTYSETGSATLNVQKHLTLAQGTTFPTGGFTFKVEQTEGKTKTFNGLAEDGTVIVNNTDAKSIGSIDFGDADDDTYIYKITEVVPGNPAPADRVADNIKYDSTTHYVKIVVASGAQKNGSKSVTVSTSTDGTNYTNVAANQVFTAEFTNKQVGSLTVSKAVANATTTDTAGATKDFEFKVTLTNSNNTPYRDSVMLSGTPTATSVTPNEDGEITLTLKHSESKTISEIPFGVKYKVEETADLEYTSAVTSGNAEGTIDGTTHDVSVAYTNTKRIKNGSATIRKIDSESKALITASAATFILYKKDASDPAKKYYLKTAGVVTNGKLTAGPEWTENDSDALALTTTVAPATGTDQTAGTVKVIGLPYGTYYVHETTAPDTYVPAATDAEVVLSEANPDAEVSVENAKGNGSLQITKNVTGVYTPDADSYEDTFYFTVQDKDGYYYSQTGAKVGTTLDNSAVLTMAYEAGTPLSKSLPVSGLTSGETYTVTEVQKKAENSYEPVGATYKYTVSYDSSTTTTAADEQKATIGSGTVTVAVTNALKTGSVFFTKKDSVSKAVLSGATFKLEEKTGASARREILSFTTGKTEENYTVNPTYADSFTNADVTVAIDATGKVTISGLHFGNYVLTETAAPSADYQAPAANDPGVEFTVSSDAAVSIGTNGEILNTRKTGEIEVSKTVVGTTEDFTFNFEFTDPYAGVAGYTPAYETTYTGKTGTTEAIAFTAADGKVTGTATLANGQSVKISGIPVGTKYKVTETANSSYIATVQVGSGTVSTSNVAGGTDNDKITTDLTSVSYTNTKKSGLNITKSNVDGKATDEFTVYVEIKTAGSDNWTAYTGNYKIGSETKSTTDGNIKFTGGQTITIEGLASGTQYRFKEVLADNSPYTAGYKKGTTTASPSADGENAGYVSGTIGSDAESWTLTNTYDTGSVTFRKVDDKDSSKLVAASFALQVKGSGDAYTDYVSFEIAKKADNSGYEVKNVTKSADAGNCGVAIAADGTVTISKLLWNTYRLVETATETGYDSTKVDGTNFIWIGSDFTINATESTHTQALGNVTNNKLTKNLSVTKQVVGSRADQALDKKYTFTVHINDGYAGKNTDGTNYEYTWKIKTGEADAVEQSTKIEANEDVEIELSHNQTAIIEGIPYGATYMVKENTTGLTNMQAAVTPVSGDATKLTTPTDVVGVSGTIADDNVTVTFTNTKLVDITLTKDQVGGLTDDTFTFTLDLKDTPVGVNYNVTYWNGTESAACLDGSAETVTRGSSNTIVLKDGMTAKVVGLPYGTKYEITENKATGSLYETRVNGGTAEAVKTGELIVGTTDASTFVNTYKTKDLTISKSVAGTGASTTKLFTFTLNLTTLGNLTSYDVEYRKNGAIIAEADIPAGNPTTVGSGNNTIKLSDGMTATVKGLEVGTTYTVTETADAEYDVAATVNGTAVSAGAIPGGSIAETSANVVAFTNTYITKGTAQFEITKAVTGTGDDTKVPNYFNFKLEAETTGAPMPTVTTAKNEGSKVKFAAISGYSATGSYIYKITETAVDTGRNGWTISETPIYVKVTVNKTGSAFVAGTPEYYSDKDCTQKLSTPTITNTYTATGTLTLEALKTMKLPETALEKFEFELRDEKQPEDKKLIETVSNGTDGKITFTALNYDQDDIGKTFEYTIREKVPTVAEQGAAEGTKYVYDRTVYTVSVKVEDNGDGTLKLTQTVKADGKDYTEGTMKFVNDTTTVKVNKVDDQNNGVKDAKLQVAVKDAAGNVVASWTSDGASKDLTGVLIAGQTYTLEEVSVPEGYAPAEPITFTVEENGSVTIGGKTVTANTVTMTDAKLHFHVNKTELGSGKEVAGAELTVIDKATGKEVDKWVSVLNGTHDFGDKLTAGKEYILRETVAPDGYAYTTDIEFKVNDNGTIETKTDVQTTTDKDGNTVYLVEDAKIKLNVNKTELGTGAEVEGAVLELYDEEGKLVESWTSKKDETHDFGDKLEAGKKYTLKETVAPDGYAYVTDITFEIQKDGTVVTDAPFTTDEKGNKTFLVEDAKIKLNVNKTELGTGAEVEGAVLELYDEEGKLVESWTSKKNETHDFGDKLEAGKKYTLKETVAPDGYAYVTDITFEIQKDGTVVTDAPFTTDEKGNKTFLVEDAKIKLNVNKVELGNGEEVDGAVLELFDETGRKIDSWTSRKGETHDFGDKLEAGKTYILKETVAPDGYVYATDIEFKVGKDGTIETTAKKTVDEKTGIVTYLMEDARAIEVSKVDIGTGEELTGAHIQVLDKDGKVVDEWDSESGKKHPVKGLKIGEEYILRETVAPAGYDIATDTKFTIDNEGRVTGSVTIENGVVLVEDKLVASENTKVTVQKTLTFNGLDMFAPSVTFYVGLFYDEACTKPATGLKELKFENMSSTTATFDNLEVGRTYYVGECDENGNVVYSGALADGTIYNAQFTGTNGNKVVTDDGETMTVALDNQLTKWPLGYYAGGELTVVKELFAANGEAKNSDEVFYAGVFSDPEYTQLSTDVETNILTLDLAGGSTATATTLVTLASVNASATLYVTEVDAEGNPVAGSAGFQYDVTVDQTEVTINPENLYATVTITNTEHEDETEQTDTETESETETKKQTESETKKTSTTPRTGDDTPFGTYAGLMAIAFAAFVLLIAEEQRRRRTGGKQ